jgi:putative MFS transporter
MAQSNPTPTGREPLRANSVQGYLDESPLWGDGTAAPPSRLTQMQQRIWWLSVAGKFFEGLVVFLTGVALPLIAKEYDLTKAQHGIVGAASLFGILIGASALGGLSDRFGRKPMFVFEMGLFIFFLALIVFTQNFIWLVVCLFGMGLALGCDYPTAHLVISESTPTRSGGKLVLSAFGFQAAGALIGTAIGYLILANDPDVERGSGFLGRVSARPPRPSAGATASIAYACAFPCAAARCREQRCLRE